MCLMSVNSDLPEPKGTGYKIVVRMATKKLRPLFYGKRFLMRKWKRASNGTLFSNRGYESYPAGFHVYTNLQETELQLNRTVGKLVKGERAVLVEVKYSGGRAHGWQHNQRVVIAARIKPMRIIKEICQN